MWLVARGTEPGQQHRSHSELLQRDKFPPRMEQDGQGPTQTLQEVVHCTEGMLIHVHWLCTKERRIYCCTLRPHNTQLCSVDKVACNFKWYDRPCNKQIYSQELMIFFTFASSLNRSFSLIKAVKELETKEPGLQLVLYTHKL